MSEYYRAYEARYRAVREIGEFTWGHTPDDAQLAGAVGDWVRAYDLTGKTVAESACGEGAGGVLLCRLGCIYNGYDIAPTAVEIARQAVAGFPGAKVEQRDIVAQPLPENSVDGALDVSGLHMIVTDADRAAYIGNIFNALKSGGSALFWQESYRSEAYEGAVTDIEDLMRLTGLDFNTPQKRRIGNSGKEVMLPLLPARPRTKEGYVREFENAGFRVVRMQVIKDSDFMESSIGILVEKPQQKATR